MTEVLTAGAAKLPVFEFRVSVTPGRYPARYISASGELLAHGDDVLRQLIAQFVNKGYRLVQIDLGGITAADGEGIQALRDIRATLTQAGVKLRLRNHNFPVYAAGADGRQHPVALTEQPELHESKTTHATDRPSNPVPRDRKT